MPPVYEEERREMRARIFLLAILATTAACDDSPSRPATEFPAMTGLWGGTLNINNGVNVCNYSWSITSQTAGSFAGSYEASGTCRLSNGTVSGTVSEAGAISFSPLLPLDNDCTRLAGGTVTGTVTGSTLSATGSESQRCNTPTGLFEFTRTYAVTLTKS
jgi:NADH:ubiquinone oxidoreductase subunit F (NADH-binding)